jgi:cytoskeletal protein RodZ
MHKFKNTFIAFAFLLFAAFAWAQEPRDEAKPPQHEQPAAEEHDAAPPAHHDEARPSRQQEEAKPPREEKPGKQQEEVKPPKEKNEARPANEQHGQERSRQQAQQGQHARPAGKSARIPEQKFKASFGRQHSFAVNRIINTTTIVPNQTQFVISGFTFVFLDPWPVGWAFTDDCFIEFVDDDYFLFDAFHPGVRVALFVVG